MIDNEKSDLAIASASEVIEKSIEQRKELNRQIKENKILLFIAKSYKNILKVDIDKSKLGTIATNRKNQLKDNFNKIDNNENIFVYKHFNIIEKNSLEEKRVQDELTNNSEIEQRKEELIQKRNLQEERILNFDITKVQPISTIKSKIGSINERAKNMIQSYSSNLGLKANYLNAKFESQNKNIIIKTFAKTKKIDFNREEEYEEFIKLLEEKKLANIEKTEEQNRANYVRNFDQIQKVDTDKNLLINIPTTLTKNIKNENREEYIKQIEEIKNNSDSKLVTINQEKELLFNLKSDLENITDSKKLNSDLKLKRTKSTGSVIGTILVLITTLTLGTITAMLLLLH